MSTMSNTARPSPTSTICSQTDDIPSEINQKRRAEDLEERTNNGDTQNIIDIEKQNRRSDNSDDVLEGGKRKGEEEWVVKFEGEDDPDDPLNTPKWRKWYVACPCICRFDAEDRLMTILLAGACICVTCCSSMAGSTYAGLAEEFSVGEEVCILSVSLFVAGLGTGPCELSL